MPRIRFSQEQHPGFYAAVKSRAVEYLIGSGRSRFGGRAVAFKGLVYSSIAAGTYVLAVRGDAGAPWSLALAVVCGVSTLLLAINAAHDAAHNCLSSHPWVNRAVLTACFTLLGASGFLWRQRHVRSHHVFPNVNGCDIDIDETPLLRLSPNHRRRWFHRFQHVYAPAAYALVFIHTVFVQDFVYLFRRELANMHDIHRRGRDYAAFALCKGAYLSIALAAPMALSPFAWWRVLVAYLVATVVASAVFVYALIGTHFCEATEFPERGPGDTLPWDWATHALVTSADWSPRSRVVNFIFGGANAHAAHHLFPNVCHTHYPALSRIIAEEAARFGVRYNVMTLPEMIASHFRLLRRLGTADTASEAEAPALGAIGPGSVRQPRRGNLPYLPAECRGPRTTPPPTSSGSNIAP